jgi:hypothetical protein
MWRCRGAVFYEGRESPSLLPQSPLTNQGSPKMSIPGMTLTPVQYATSWASAEWVVILSARGGDISKGPNSTRTGNTSNKAASPGGSLYFKGIVHDVWVPVRRLGVCRDAEDRVRTHEPAEVGVVLAGPQVHEARRVVVLLHRVLVRVRPRARGRVRLPEGLVLDAVLFRPHRIDDLPRRAEVVGKEVVDRALGVDLRDPHPLRVHVLRDPIRFGRRRGTSRR